VLRLSNGGVASLTAAAHSPGAADEEQIEIDGGDGRIDLHDPGSGRAGELVLFLRRPWEGLAAGTRVVVNAGRSDTYLELLRGFVRSLRDGTAPPATADDAAEALATVLAIYASAGAGHTVTVTPG